ncbi:hypothetical protein CQA53_06310 [Helicobacter didelphidarum]|uniref:Outer membrane protein n=1 Tax=Helicobacter didelphidarum TaxID=2040648 RepID=A0A3D8IJT5_9HELI|nr:hypothetical protein [Helicobacter didelphidarum]RDU65383.1 hypothetical protein CQA53_06310 [Helicobacter didelphidarum]
MKKILICVFTFFIFIQSAYSFAFRGTKDGYAFVGADIGYTIGRGLYVGDSRFYPLGGIIDSAKTHGMALQINAGNEFNWGDYFAFRFFFNVIYNFTFNLDARYQQHIGFGLYLDFIWKAYQTYNFSFQIYVGLAPGEMMFSLYRFGENMMNFASPRVGMMFAFDENNRIDFSILMPIATMSFVTDRYKIENPPSPGALDTGERHMAHSPMRIMIGYKYYF